MIGALANPMYAIPARSGATNEFKEYYYLQDMTTGFNQDCLEIKKWSVALASIIAGLGQASLANPTPMLVIVMLLAVSFWITETFWRVSQWAFIRRIREIEAAGGACPTISSGWARFYHGPIDRPRPHSDWNGAGREGGFAGFVRNGIALRTSLPHALILAAAFGFWLDFACVNIPPPARMPQQIAGRVTVNLVGSDAGSIARPAAIAQPAARPHK